MSKEGNKEKLVVFQVQLWSLDQICISFCPSLENRVELLFWIEYSFKGGLSFIFSEKKVL